MLVMGGGVPDVPPASDLPTLWADLPIGVGDRDVIGVNLTLATGARLTGQVVFEGSPPTPAEMPRLGVGLVAADDGAGQLPPIAPVDLSTRQFRTAQYPAGRYLLNLPAPPGGWSVRSAIVDGVNINEQPLVLSGSDISGVVVTLSRQPTTLSGSVRRGVGTGDPRAAVAVFPADYHAWIESGMSGRRFRTTAVQADGTFEIAGLGAGEYLVAVVGAEYPMDGRNPATIDALASVATRVSVREGINQAPALGVSMLR
jgi:hypothetical protein